MSWQIKAENGRTEVLLDSELGIQNAADFHQAVLPLAVTGAAVRINAQAARAVHSSILQILYALSQAVPDFGVTDASAEFQATEKRVGFSLARADETQISTHPSEPA
jgi:anti-anti-sigma regulatory factor